PSNPNLRIRRMRLMTPASLIRSSQQSWLIVARGNEHNSLQTTLARLEVECPLDPQFHPQPGPTISAVRSRVQTRFETNPRSTQAPTRKSLPRKVPIHAPSAACDAA